MTAPEALSRPLAGRITGLPEPDAPAEVKTTLPQPVIDAAIDALNRGETHYTTRPGLIPLRQAVANDLRDRFEIEIPPDEITVTCGATEARFAALRVLAQPGSRVVCPGNSAPIAGVIHLTGAQLVTDAHDPAAVNMVYLTPDDEQDVINTLLEHAADHKWWVIWDTSEAKQQSAFHPAQNESLAPNVITIGSWDAHLPGWRVGWMAGSEAAGKLRAFKQSLTICTTNVSQWAALALMER